MSIRVETCPSCGSRYNGNEYQNCPYCSNVGKSKSIMPKTGSLREEKTITKSKGWPWKKHTETTVTNDEHIAALNQVSGSISTSSETQESFRSETHEIPGIDLNRHEVRKTVGFFDVKSKAENMEREPLDFGNGLHATQQHMMQSMKQASDVSSICSDEIDYGSAEDMLSGVIAVSTLTPDSVNTPISTQTTPLTGVPVQESPSVPMSVGSGAISLDNRLEGIGKTVGANVSISASGEVTYPTVGWLLCVKGVYYGKSFPLKSGANRVSRSADKEISLPNDASVSRDISINIAYEPKKGKFIAIGGNSSSASYVNEEALWEGDRMSIKAFDTIELGDSGKNKFLFIPLCGDNFSWDNYPQE